jgi:hypothetical protein
MGPLNPPKLRRVERSNHGTSFKQQRASAEVGVFRSRIEEVCGSEREIATASSTGTAETPPCRCWVPIAAISVFVSRGQIDIRQVEWLSGTAGDDVHAAQSRLSWRDGHWATGVDRRATTQARTRKSRTKLGQHLPSGSGCGTLQRSRFHFGSVETQRLVQVL